jgi:hypothetical protein
MHAFAACPNSVAVGERIACARRTTFRSACYNTIMTPALEEVIERLRQMPEERQEAFARMLLREILADEQWMRSAAHNSQPQQQRTDVVPHRNPDPRLAAPNPYA